MKTDTPPTSDVIAPSDEAIIRAARLMASRAMSQRDHYERMADAFTHAYNERDAGLRKAYDEAARSFGELAYQVADQFHIPGSEIEPARQIAAQPGEVGVVEGGFVEGPREWFITGYVNSAAAHAHSAFTSAQILHLANKAADVTQFPPHVADALDGEVWRNAVLDHLAVTAMDAPLGEPPFKTIGRIIDWHVAVATDPRVNGGFVLVPQAEVSDGERLDWLALHPLVAQIVINGETKDCIFWGLSSNPENTLREAIDAARAEAGDDHG